MSCSLTEPRERVTVFRFGIICALRTAGAEVLPLRPDPLRLNSTPDCAHKRVSAIALDHNLRPWLNVSMLVYETHAVLPQGFPSL